MCCCCRELVLCLPPSSTDRCLVICVKGDPPLNGIVSVTPQEEAVVRAEASQAAAFPCNCCPGTSGGRGRQRDAACVPPPGGASTPQTHKTVQSSPATPLLSILSNNRWLTYWQAAERWCGLNVGKPWNIWKPPIVVLNGRFEVGAVKQVSDCRTFIIPVCI